MAKTEQTKQTKQAKRYEIIMTIISSFSLIVIGVLLGGYFTTLDNTYLTHLAMYLLALTVGYILHLTPSDNKIVKR